MTSHKKKIIFIHIPKTGGTSVIRSLKPLVDEQNFLTFGHYTIEALEKFPSMKKKEYSNYFRFAFIRDPVDRLISAFHFLQNGGVNEYDKEWSEKLGLKKYNFEEFVLSKLDKLTLKKNLAPVHFLQQVYFISGSSSPINLFKFENFKESMLYISSLLGIEPSLLEIQHANRGKYNKNINRNLDSHIVNKIKEIYSEDFELYYSSKGFLKIFEQELEHPQKVFDLSCNL